MYTYVYTCWPWNASAKAARKPPLRRSESQPSKGAPLRRSFFTDTGRPALDVTSWHVHTASLRRLLFFRAHRLLNAQLSMRLCGALIISLDSGSLTQGGRNEGG